MIPQSIIGIVSLILIAILFSENRRAISIRAVTGSLAILLGVAGFVLGTESGADVLLAISNGVGSVFGYGMEGIKFAFGNLVSFQVEGLGFIWVFHVLPMIIFTAALTSILYYLGIMQWFVRIIGGGLQKVLGTSRAESMSAAGNIVLGQTEAPLLVKPYHPYLTRAQLFAVMVGGLASIAGSILAGLSGMGVELKYLIMACFMSAPAGLLFAKLIVPETEKTIEEVPEAKGDDKSTSLMDALAKGSMTGLAIAGIVGSVLISTIALIALINGGLGWIGGFIGMETLTLDMILGFLFAPVAWLIGVPWSEAATAGAFLGQKIALNEFVAFAGLAGVELSAKATAIMTIALCGFANISSVAMVTGAMCKMIPEKSKIISGLGWKVLLAATLANLMSATVVGLFV